VEYGAQAAGTQQLDIDSLVYLKLLGIVIVRLRIHFLEDSHASGRIFPRFLSASCCTLNSLSDILRMLQGNTQQPSRFRLGLGDVAA
jgi:hypothetical protein